MKKQLLLISIVFAIVAIIILSGVTVLVIVMMTSPARHLANAIRQGDIEGIRRLAAGRTDLGRIRLSGGLSPLSFAIKEGKPDCVLALLAGGFDPNARNRDGTAPIHHAAAADSPVFLEYLLTHGADPDLLVDGRSSGEFPLSWAIYSGNVENAVLLMERGANVDAVDSYGRNMLLQAWEVAEFQIVYQLLEHGADINAPGRQDFTFIEHVRYAKPSLYRNHPGQRDYWCEQVLEWLSARGIDVKSATWAGDRWKF